MSTKDLFKPILLFLIILSLNLNVSSQTEISGMLTDSTGFKIPGAQIVEMGTLKGVASDIKGRFKLRVADTSKIHISMIGYYDTIMSPPDLQGDTILMRQRFYLGDLIHSITYHQSFTIGLFGDVKYMPFGLKFRYYRPYLFGRKFFTSAGFSIKTNFRTDYDLSINLNRYGIIDVNNYNMTIWTKYQNRKINLNNNILRSQDFEFITRNYFFDKIGVSPGLLYRKQTFELTENYFGFYAGIDWDFDRIDQFWNVNMSYFKNYPEFSIIISQGFSNCNYPISRFRVSLNYITYRYYNELNLRIIYSIY